MFPAKQQISISHHLQNVGESTEYDIELNDGEVVLPALVADCDVSHFDVEMYLLTDFLHLLLADLVLET